ncbi:stringent starvation protein B [Halioglobus sp. HI00S01]|uniref:ClpXP protease specificity-enhancing factor n=1 Tax=Halioglobus sp. HI00S01 TaxID=1822214 RepID=UPI0007C2794D|nr:ClpXP protease specificity-enhancing factor [Halioglobus sp. HI00S01]KZX59509.1 stringent starvation protein B [Halioglobus sp. HI00S01]
MTPSRPYIMRALYEWIVDNSCTPYILVDATMEDVSVPEQYVKDGQIVLNISPTAVMDLDMSNDAVVFNGRFGGVATDVYVPVTAVVGIYARENGQGMVFESEEPPEDDPTPPEDTPPEPSGKPEGRPSLKIVK